MDKKKIETKKPLFLLPPILIKLAVNKPLLNGLHDEQVLFRRSLCSLQDNETFLPGREFAENLRHTWHSGLHLHLVRQVGYFFKLINLAASGLVAHRIFIVVHGFSSCGAWAQ